MYALIENNNIKKYPYSVSDFRRDNPNISLPSTITDSTLASHGILPVSQTVQPTITSLQNITEDTPIKINGVWTQQWIVTDANPEEIAQRKTSKWEQIKQYRDNRKSGGVKVGDYWFHTDADSRIQHISLVMMGANMPTGIQWKTMSGDFVEMTPVLAQNILNNVAVNDQTVFAIAEQHRIAMEAGSDPSNYDFTDVWPAVYGEE